MDASQIIEARGGPKAVADALSVTPGSVRVWKCRNRIPRSAWPDIVRAFPSVTIDDLVKSEAAA